MRAPTSSGWSRYTFLSTALGHLRAIWWLRNETQSYIIKVPQKAIYNRTNFTIKQLLILLLDSFYLLRSRIPSITPFPGF